MKKLLPLGLVLATALSGTLAHAASSTWNTSGTDGNWFTAGNWGSGVPGSTSTTTSTDVATFLSSTSGTVLINTVSGTLNVSGISFGAATTALTSITIGTTGGNPIYLSSGGSIQFLADTTPSNITETVNAPLILGGNATFTNNNGTSTNVLNIGGAISDATASAITLTLAGSNTATNTISGNISGNIGVTHSNSVSVWNLTGNNSYSGATALSGGTTILAGNNSAMTGSVTVSSGATLDINNNNALGSGTFTINNGAKIDNTSGGAVALAANNAVTIGGSFTYSGSNSLNLGTGAVNFSSGSASTWTVSGGTLTLGGSISGTKLITEAGAGTLILTGSNSISGGFTLGASATAAGALDINNASALGTGTLTFAAPSTGTLVIDNTTNAAITNAGNNAQAWNTSFTYNGTQALNLGTGSVTLGTTATLTTVSNNLTVGGIIGSGSTNGLVKAGNGTLTLTGASLYTGTTTVSAGTLILGNTAALNGAVTLNGGTLDLATDTSTNAYTTNVTANSTVESDKATAASAGITQTLGALNIGAFTLNATAGPNVSGGTPVVAFGATTLSNGNNTSTPAVSTLNPTTAAITLTSVVGNQGSSGFDALDLDGTSSGNAITGVIGNGSHGKLDLVKSNTSTWTLSGTNIYTGSTTISGGNLQVNGILNSGSAVTLGTNTSAVAILSGTGTISGSLTTSTTGSNIAYIAPGTNGSGTRGDFGSVGTLHVGSLGFSIGAGTQFDYDITGSTTNDDLLTMTGGTLTVGGSGIVFNFNQLSSLTAGTAYTLISGATSVSGFLASDFSATGDSGYTAAFANTGTAITVTFTATGSGSPNYYFTGTNSGTFTDAGNYFTAATGGTQQTTALSSTSNVFLNANSVSTTDTLNTSTSINSLNFVTAGTSLAGSGTVTLAATGTAGITDSAGVAGQTETVAPAVVLGSNQSWVSTANSTLNVTGNVSGAQSLAVTGAGAVNLGGANTFQGLTVGTGSDTPTLYLTNGTSGSATGTTTLRVNAGATLAGNGTSSGTSFNVSGTGTTTSARANILVGLTSATDTTVGNKLTLIGSTGTSTIADANLTFNLSATSTASNQLSVGTTAIAFGTDAGSVKFSLNLQGEPAIVANGTLYTLIAGTSSSNQYSGLTLGNVINLGGGVTETIITGNNLQVAFGNSTDTTYYGNGSYLVLYQAAGVDDIDVVVVPEPGTWAMMLGGLALLVVVQRARRKNS